jgi:hypothetical protein
MFLHTFRITTIVSGSAAFSLLEIIDVWGYKNELVHCNEY